MPTTLSRFSECLGSMASAKLASAGNKSSHTMNISSCHHYGFSLGLRMTDTPLFQLPIRLMPVFKSFLPL
jgi:hypothetical protein